ncbi:MULTISPECIES: L-aspartate oxidase [unclassified Cryobacterium]|uniref:L-aspartate oxidase n=1 Tax=unclassified Cryobacterium TaxID=2649013 RepID=UPI00106DB516|nr:MULTISPECIES: L-aspartate oxidase [unclassified Cryobacterium]TFC56051.1 L-aspartate oxidase [Cryobacterium sp. TMB3-1-2]TFC69715.1 L-aspartate oxidase [Cryobacterium sp. TMB3-15]TFC78081.1 L-aspartate oxidase [Cryobacterium sp. TMB3-10]TFD39469.1 L-aspartate oxidase [Cryobacterium sp. TMB3-12]
MTRVLVVGSGLAGLIAAVRATDAGHRVTLVTKAALSDSNTRYAQGGIAAALFPDDSTDAHILDTLRAGAGLCDPAAVRVLCEEGPARVRDLIRFGVDFDRDESGITRGLEAAHSRSRVLHAGGDATGAAIETALVATVQERAKRAHTLGGDQITIHEHTMLVDLIATDGPGTVRVTGAMLLGPDGTQHAVAADAVILATGGAGALYRHTTNPAIATGDGVAAAWRAGAAVADVEFYQFHPTALAVPGTPLVSEAVRGEGAVLLTSTGERFMPAIHPDAELAPRDIVARSIAAQMKKQGDAPVLLDATGLGRDLLESRFPTITAACRAAGLDWAVQPIPVAPAAHYWMGGVATDGWGRTSLAGLYAVGEVARTGAHGANRLASNSLLEAAVFADRAVRALDAEEQLPPLFDDLEAVAELGSDPDEAGTLVERSTLQELLWEAAGVHRSGSGLTRAAVTLAGWRAVDRGRATVAELETGNLLDLGRLIVAAALAREESRGAHHRADFPDSRPELARPRFTRHPASTRPLLTVPSQPSEAIAC